MNVLIATGIYPPRIGGPAQYAENLKETFEKNGYKVRIATFKFERLLPPGIRHIYFFLKIIPTVIRCDFCIVMDTFSVAFPSVLAGILFGKKIIIRTGGDFLWEQYLERTKEKILLRDFYQSQGFKQLSFKEKNIFALTKWVFKNTSALVFSTEWQKNIWSEPYRLNLSKVFIIENFYGLKSESGSPTQKKFIGSSRPIQFKNLDFLSEAFNESKKIIPELSLELENFRHEEFLEKIKNCYAVILVSLGDISPNFILDAIRFNKPFILTRENGVSERVKDIAIFVDPLNKKEIAEKIIWLSSPENYEIQQRKIREFNFSHSWDEIALEFIAIYKKI